MATARKDSATFKRFVQLGRVVLVNSGPSEGKLAVIVEIIDHNRALIDGPTTGVPRQAIAYRSLILTGLVLKKLTRGARSPVVKKVWEAAETDSKWAATSWAKKLALTQKKRAMTDFERFEVATLKKQRRRALGKEAAKTKKAAA